MSAPLLRRVLLAATTAACLITLSACGDAGTPSANPSDPAASVDPTADPSATGETPPSSPPASTTAPTAPTTSSQPPASPYPNNAKDYGLAFLAAVKANDQTKIVDFGSVNVYNQVTNYNAQNLNGQWTHSNCSSGFCHYYNAVGNFAQIGIDTSKLGTAHAVTNASWDVGTFPTNDLSYLGAFITHWSNNNRVGMDAYATNNVVTFMNSRTKPTTTTMTAPTPCGSGRVCIASGTETAGGAPYGQITCYTIQTNRLGKPDGIIDAKDASSTGACP